MNRKDSKSFAGDLYYGALNCSCRNIEDEDFEFLGIDTFDLIEWNLFGPNRNL